MSSAIRTIPVVELDRHVSQLMVDILTAVSVEAGASVPELVAGVQRAGGTRKMACASVSRAIRRLWCRGAVELHGGMVTR